MAVSSAPGKIGWKAVDFELMDTASRRWRLADVRGPNGLLLMFICNHCPYVKVIIDRIGQAALTLQGMGFGVAAVMSNDAEAYPEDSFANMRALAEKRAFSFPYLYDPTQQLARDYDAVCTPDFFGFDKALALRYRGRLDSSANAPASSETRHELVAAMQQIAATGQGPAEQFASIGCSIKWRAEPAKTASACTDAPCASSHTPSLARPPPQWPPAA